jgi:hypothetical protein
LRPVFGDFQTTLGSEENKRMNTKLTDVSRALTITLLILICMGAGSRAISQPSIPGNTNPPLDTWSFADTNYWTSDLGYYPVSYTNISDSPLGPGNSLDVDGTNASWLQYNVYEADGTTNLNIVSDGSLGFWFAPNWASASDTNDLGTGPGVWSRLIEVGTYTTNASYGWWSLYMDDVGNNIYFSAQDANGDEADYLAAPVTFTSNNWHLIALTWSSTNTSLFVDGTCLTNGPGISVLPGMDVISNGFTIGSDIATGMLQMHGALNSLATYNYVLDSGSINVEAVLEAIYYLATANVSSNAPYASPGVSAVYDIISGPGYLQVTGTNNTTCLANTNVWITNVSVMPGTNKSVNLSFMVTGGNPDWPYDIFATGCLNNPITNSVWSWMGQAYPCQTNVINGLTNGMAYFLLGTPLSYDGDGFTVAYETLILHINPNDPDLAGDGIANGFKYLAGMPFTTPVSVPSLSSVSIPVCPVP